MALPSGRLILDAHLSPAQFHAGIDQWRERASHAGILEVIREQAELARVGRTRFRGTLAQKNNLWKEYRNLLRQAASNYEAALGVTNRSGLLLHYYSMLNFAKAELLLSYSIAAVGRIHHGLSFSPTNAKTIIGDSVTVRDGIFPALYKQRTGHVLPLGTRLPVNRLLRSIPEIGSQLEEIGLPAPAISGVISLTAWDTEKSWQVLAIESTVPPLGSVTYRLLTKHFRQIERPLGWRNFFGLSRRWYLPLTFWESRTVHPRLPGAGVNVVASKREVMKLRDILGATMDDEFDAWLAPSLYSSRMLPMPPSLARYAIAFYASSLVRYRPAMFDPQVLPEQAFLFDSIARECALPMLADTLTGLLDRDQYFYGVGALRA